MKLRESELQLVIPRYLMMRNYSKADGLHRLKIGATDKLKQVDLEDQALEMLLQFTEPRTVKEVASCLGIDVEQVQAGCEILREHGILVESHKQPLEMHRYDRHLLYYQLNGLNPVATQKKIGEVTIALVGMGGIGNWVALNVVGLGLKKIKLLDFDHIEETNLSRQVLFKERDIGQSKIQVSAKELRERNSSTEVEEYSLCVESSSDLENKLDDCDFVFLSADKPLGKIQGWINEVCCRLSLPYLPTGYAGGLGLVGPLVIPGQTACWHCKECSEKSVNFESLHGRLEKLIKLLLLAV